jgi:hypothetical protein
MNANENRWINDHATNGEAVEQRQRQALLQAKDGDECPLCLNGTVEIVDGETRCKGECGAVVKHEP